MAFPLLFLHTGFSLGGAHRPMKLRTSLIKLGLALLIAGSPLVSSRAASAQDASPAAAAATSAAPAQLPDSSKRKVKTRVSPEYPELAKRMNVTGHVKIEVTISMDGRVTATKVIGGNPVLVSASIDALKKWHFEAASKQTSEIIEFEFNGQN
jgi:TonB family protein